MATGLLSTKYPHTVDKAFINPRSP